MTLDFQKLSDTLEGLINEKKGIFGSILFDPHGQVVLCTQNILRGSLQLKNQTFDATDIGYVSTAISEKIKNSPESSPSQLFDDIFYLDEENAPMFVYYLNRHIELDSDSHGPAVWRIINEMTKDKPETIEELKDAARKAINARIQLWDGLTEIIQNKQKKIA